LAEFLRKIPELEIEDWILNKRTKEKIVSRIRFCVEALEHITE
jgi:hypothetical protein